MASATAVRGSTPGTRWQLGDLRAALPLAVPVLTAVVLGIWGLGTPALWYDERVTSETAAGGPLIYPWDAPIIPYYTAVWLWSLCGTFTSDVWIRGLSVLAMTIAVLAVTMTGRRLAGTRVAVAAGMIVALSPAFTRYGQEARVYALATAFVSVATWALTEAVSSHRRAWWAVYCIALLGVGGFAPFALTIVPAHGAVLLLTGNWRSNWRPWLVSLAFVVPGLMLQGVAAIRFAAMHDWVPVPSLFDLPPVLLWPLTYNGASDWSPANLAYPAVAVALCLLSPRGTRWLIAVAVAGLALWIASHGPSSFWLIRSMVPLSGMLAVGAALALRDMTWVRITAVIALLGFLAWPSLVALRSPGAKSEDVKVAAQIIDQQWRPGDVVSNARRDWLEWGVKRYSADPSRYKFAPVSTGRAWVWNADVRDITCDRLAEWQVPSAGLLVLCSSLPQGWADTPTAP